MEISKDLDNILKIMGSGSQDNIDLGIELIKSQGLQTEFEDYCDYCGYNESSTAQFFTLAIVSVYYPLPDILKYCQNITSLVIGNRCDSKQKVKKIDSFPQWLYKSQIKRLHIYDHKVDERILKSLQTMPKIYEASINDSKTNNYDILLTTTKIKSIGIHDSNISYLPPAPKNSSLEYLILEFNKKTNKRCFNKFAKSFNQNIESYKNLKILRITCTNKQRRRLEIGIQNMLWNDDINCNVSLNIDHNQKIWGLGNDDWNAIGLATCIALMATCLLLIILDYLHLL